MNKTLASLTVVLAVACAVLAISLTVHRNLSLHVNHQRLTAAQGHQVAQCEARLESGLVLGYTNWRQFPYQHGVGAFQTWLHSHKLDSTAQITDAFITFVEPYNVDHNVQYCVDLQLGYDY